MHLSTLVWPLFSALILAGPSLAISTRARIASDRLRKYAAHPDYGVPQGEIDAVAGQKRDDSIDPRDLVALLIADNRDIWQQLLHNPFIEAMKTAGTDNETVLNGYMWYEIQDYWYCARLLAFDIERSLRAQTIDEFNSSVSDVVSDAPPPAGLGINTSVVLSATPTKALDQYTDFQFVAAKDYSWVVSLAAQIPCIQSYYYIAQELVNTSSFTDTFWYNQWVLPNLDYSYLQPQIDFFMANYEYWAPYYEDITFMFRKATLSEYNLWQVAFEPGYLG